MSDCTCARCRVDRGEIPPGPYTPAEFAKLGLARPTVTNPGVSVDDDPGVTAAALALEQARFNFSSGADAKWREACLAARDAELLAWSHDRATALKAQRQMAGLRDAVRAASEDRDLAWRGVVKAQMAHHEQVQRAVLEAMNTEPRRGRR